MTKKTAILIDTNVFLTNWNVIFQQGKNDVIVPYKVLEELDKHKKRQDSLGNNARNIIRFFDELRSKGDLVNGVQIREDCGMLFCKGVSNINILPAEYEHNNPDNQILAVALEIFHHKKNVTVLSQDINLRIKCAALGIPTDDYREDNIIVEKTELYRGWREYKLDDDFIDRFYSGEEMFIEDSSLFPNEFLVLKSEINNQKSALCRWVNKGIPLRKVSSSFSNDWGFVANNKEQLFALDLLFDPDVPIVSLAGPAGTGKSVLSVLAGLSQVNLSVQGNKKTKNGNNQNKQYKKLLISRPIMPMGKDIGYLPGPLPSETDILTPNGWKKLSQLSVGDFVIGKNGKSVKINHIFEKGKKEKIKISFQDGTSAECCEDHLWQVYKPSCDVSYTISTKDIEERYKVDIKKKWWQRLFIDLVEPVEYETKQEITINPYVLGCILGDGCITAKYANEFSCNELELVERINSYLPENIILKYKSGRTYTFTMKENIGNVKRKANIMTEQINNLGLRGKSSRTKFIPRKYLFSSVEDRILLLQGLMDTDGYVSKDGHDVSYTTTSKQLAEDFKELVLSLGGLANIKFSEKKFNSYTISVSFHKNIIPFSLLRKIKRYKHRRNICKRRIEKIERTGTYVDMKCININSEDGLFVINDFIVTHNSKQEKLDPWISPIRDNMAFLFGGDEYHIDEYIERKIIEIEAPTYIRGRSIQNAYMLIDESQNLNRNEMKTIMTRVGYNTKIVLTGDLSQIDNINLDEYSSGLTHLVERLKHSQLSGHVYLDQGERSEVATLCAEKL